MSKLHVETIHSATGPCVLWLHGFLGCGEDWRWFAQRLPGRTHLLIDLPGHGATSPLSEEDWLVALPALLDELVPSGRPVFVVGYSMGARVAMKWLATTETKVSVACLVSGHPGFAAMDQRRARFEVDEARAAEMLSVGLAGFVERWYASPLLRELHELDCCEAVMTRRARGSTSARAAALLGMSSGRQADLLPQLRRRSTRLHWIAGERDERYDALLQGACQAVPGSRLHRAPGAGHQVPLAKPQWLLELLDQLLAVDLG